MLEYFVVETPRDYKALIEPAAMAALEKKFQEAEKANQSLYQKKLDAHKSLIEQAIQLYGGRSKVVQYLRNNKPDAPRSTTKLLKSIHETVARLTTREASKIKRAENAERKRQEEAAAAELRRIENQKKAQRRKERLDEVSANLKAAGYVVGEDFRRHDSIRFMKAHREWVFDEEIGKHRAVIIPKVPQPSREELAYPLSDSMV